MDRENFEREVKGKHYLEELHPIFPNQKVFLTMRPSWEQYFMIIAKIIALRSTCNSRPGGAIVVRDNRILATGYTGSVHGAFQCSDKGPYYCFRRDSGASDIDKYNICKSIHAEQNTIAYAAKFGVSLNGGIMYCTLQPCYICLKSIAASGIKEVNFELLYESNDKKRDDSWKNAFKEFKIECKQIEISDFNIQLAIEFIQNPTSYRRLKPTK